MNYEVVYIKQEQIADNLVFTIFVYLDDRKAWIKRDMPLKEYQKQVKDGEAKKIFHLVLESRIEHMIQKREL